MFKELGSDIIVKPQNPNFKDENKNFASVFRIKAP